jgi:hypothetical protein
LLGCPVQAPVNCGPAVEKRLTPKIEWLGTLPVKVVGYMAAILTPEDVVRRIAAECAYVNERGGVGIRLEPAAAIVRQYGDQFRAPRRQRRPRSAKPPTLL